MKHFVESLLEEKSKAIKHLMHLGGEAHLISKAETDAELTNAFHSRAIEIITKLRLICSDDSALIAELNGISKRMNNKKKDK